LPETAGDAALLVDPYDEDGWVDALRRVLDDTALRHDLQVRGRARAVQFSWAATAAATLALYRQAAGRV
jgi:glycosyltransferase involved in cell wall biosynthesis